MQKGAKVIGKVIRVTGNYLTVDVGHSTTVAVEVSGNANYYEGKTVHVVVQYINPAIGIVGKLAC